MHQKELAILSDIKRPIELAPLEVVTMYRDEREAMRGQMGTIKQEYFANTLGLDKGRFSRILGGSLHFPDEKIKDFCRLTGRADYIQYLAHTIGYQLVPLDPEQALILKQQEEIERLKLIVQENSL